MVNTEKVISTATWVLSHIAGNMQKVVYSVLSLGEVFTNVMLRRLIMVGGKRSVCLYLYFNIL